MLAIKSELRRLSQQCVSTNSHGRDNGDGNENDVTFSAWETSTDYFEFYVANDVIHDNHDNHDAYFVCLDQGGESIQKFEDEALVCSMIL
mmetsp:Transcript_21781/g.39526  ORF Transcript_21781/g.39526 Transcript_21781/m.39526 type:complete len:90 (-) Transcript_21781:1636-1905(-)